MGAKGLPIPWEQFTVADLGSQVDRNPEKGMGGGELRQRAPPVGGSSLEVVEMNQSVEEKPEWEGKCSLGPGYLREEAMGSQTNADWPTALLSELDLLWNSPDGMS